MTTKFDGSYKRRYLNEELAGVLLKAVAYAKCVAAAQICADSIL